jgi:hypothetical protein
VLAIVGYATKGPIGVPTLVESRSNFNEQFGTTVIGSPYAALAAYRAFNQGNKIIFHRVATVAASADASDVGAIEAEAIVTNIAPATYATMGLDLGEDPILGLTDATEYSVDITIDGGTMVNAAFTTTGTTETVANVLSAVQGALATEGSGATAALLVDIITITSGTLGATGTVLIASGGTIADNDLIGIGGTSPVVATVAAAAGTDDMFKIVAYEQEKRDYSKILFNKKYKDLTSQEQSSVNNYVAEIVKNILPNYSRIGKLGKAMKALPVAGTFISFQLEVYRTSGNTLSLIAKELKGDIPGVDAEAKSRLRRKGAKRSISSNFFLKAEKFYS